MTEREKRLKRCKEWYRLHREESLAKTREYYLAHREELIAKQKARYRNNPELRELAAKRIREAHRRNPEHYKQWRREYAASGRKKQYPHSKKKAHLRAKYGITVEEYNKLLETQENKCAMGDCRTSDTGSKYGWYVDHDHETGVIRGLLCHHCNQRLGFYEKNKGREKAFEEYLLRGGRKKEDMTGAVVQGNGSIRNQLQRREIESAIAQGIAHLHEYELKMVLMVVSRLIRGQQAIGPFDKNRRNMAAEASEEGVDGCLYSIRGMSFEAIDLFIKATIASLRK